MAFDPISGGLGILGLLMQSDAQGQQLALQVENQRYQRQEQAKQDRFAQATRTDAYGNQQRYNAATNTWEMINTPTQNQILKAGEKEQLLSLTEDAQRNRQIKENAFARGKDAAQDYNRVLADYRYNNPKSDLATRDELASIAGPSAEAGMKSGQAASIRQALRTGAGSLIPTIIKSTDDALGQDLSQRNLGIRNQAVQESQQHAAAHEQLDMPQLQALQQTMDAGGGAPQQFSTLPQASAGVQASMAQAIQQAMQSGSSAVGAANNAVAAAAGKSPDFGKLASYFTGGTTRGGTKQAKTGYSLVSPTPNTADDDSYEAIYSDPNWDNSRIDNATTGWF